jgi:hypothetical protein
VPFRSVGVDLDDAALSELLRNPSRTTSLSADSTAQAVTVQERGAAISCLRSAAGGQLASETTLVQLIEASYRGTPAFVGIYESTSDDRGRLLFVAAQDGCRLLASGSSASGTVTPTE